MKGADRPAACGTRTVIWSVNPPKSTNASIGWRLSCGKSRAAFAAAGSGTIRCSALCHAARRPRHSSRPTPSNTRLNGSAVSVLQALCGYVITASTDPSLGQRKRQRPPSGVTSGAPCATARARPRRYP